MSGVAVHRRGLPRLLLGIPATLGLLAAGLPLPGTPAHPACVSAASAHHAAVVLEHGDGAVITRCVGFDADRVSGEQLLSLSGIEYATADFGSIGKAVCQIDGEPGSYPPSCWTSTSPYWAMFVSRGGGAWIGSDLGVTNQTFGDGDAEGFRYNRQDGSGGPPASPAGVCPARAVATAPPSPGSVAVRPGAGTSHPAAGTSHPGARSTATPRAATAASVPAGPQTQTGGPAGAVAIRAGPSSTPLAQGAGSVSPIDPSPAAATVNPGLLTSCAVLGVLLGLTALQLMKARRRRQQSG